MSTVLKCRSLRTLHSDWWENVKSNALFCVRVKLLSHSNRLTQNEAL
jgi:hypothetical protein